MPGRNDFIFSPAYRLARHTLFWGIWLILWTIFWTFVWSTFEYNFKRITIWIPVFILYTYPVSHYAIKQLLLKNKYIYFTAFILLWSVVGWYTNIYFRFYIFDPLQELWSIPHTNSSLREPHSLLCMATTVSSMSAAILMKHWTVTQTRWEQSEREKVTAELQLLKAQLHPHFLFNTLNNIYSFALHSSPQTPQMILKLSSLLSYILYECKTDEVLLEKEVEVMKDYIGLEKERYGDKIDISVNIEGDIQNKFITPLLILPFLENAFKHGTSEQLQQSWISVDIAVKGDLLQCKVVNSKNEVVPFHENGVGINNVKKRLEFLYPGKHDLKLADEGQFFVVALLLHLRSTSPEVAIPKQNLKKLAHEIEPVS